MSKKLKIEGNFGPSLPNTGPFVLCADEVGKGSLAGWATIGVVALPEHLPDDWSIVIDSKKYTKRKNASAHEQRCKAASVVRRDAVAFAVVDISQAAIAKYNILWAIVTGVHIGCQAICNPALVNLEDGLFRIVDLKPFSRTSSGEPRLDGVLMDGCASHFKPFVRKIGDTQVEVPWATMTKGDSFAKGISAAALLAKTHRDEAIEALCDKVGILDAYEMRKHHGYAGEKQIDMPEHSQRHMAHIIRMGPTVYHRLTFAPSKGLLEKLRHDTPRWPVEDVDFFEHISPPLS